MIDHRLTADTAQPPTAATLAEASTPMLSTSQEHRNASDLLAFRVTQAPSAVAFEVRQAGAPVTGPWRDVTTAEFEAEVRALAKGLIAVGVTAGEGVAIMSATSYEWAVTEMACWYAGAVIVPLYDTAAQAQVDAIVADAEVTLAFAGDAEQADKLRHALAPQSRNLGVWLMKDLVALADAGTNVADAVVEERRGVADLDTVATIVYTSGTTGTPKGALLTHRNFVHQVLNVAAAYREVIYEGGSTIIFLPLAHVLARGLQLVCLANGMRIAHLSSPKDVVPALSVLRPTFLVVVPRVLQKVLAAATTSAQRKGLGRLWRAAQRTAVEWAVHLERVQDQPDVRPDRGLALRHRLYDRLFFGRVRTLFGGRVDYLLSGAAPLEADLCRFFWGAGLPVVEGYGLTETTAPLTGNLPTDIRPGSVGVPLPGTTVRISADGEVLARGAGVFAGYHRAADNTDAFVDGFFRTGDLGELDDQGRLRLFGRCKDVVVTSGGKTVAPGPWENWVEQDPLVAHAVLVGDSQPYLGAVLLLDPDELHVWAGHSGDAAVPVPGPDGSIIEVTSARLRARLEATVQAANARFSRAEQAQRFALALADLSEGSGLLTPTMKLKRNELLARAETLVRSLYPRP
jgi:long-chain acyl-CoA synthetase